MEELVEAKGVELGSRDVNEERSEERDSDGEEYEDNIGNEFCEEGRVVESTTSKGCA